MRFAKLANLTWRDVDLENRFLFVRSNDSFKTKTANSERIIPILDFLMNILSEIKPVQESDYVFKTPEGRQLKERRLLAVCKKVAEKAGIKSNAYLHKFRHTYATMLVQRGTGIYAVKELLGHSSVTQTEIYAHHRSDLLHSDVSKLNNLLSR